MIFNNLLKSYGYHLPEKLIAQQPASPRDSARLLVYHQKTKSISFDTFKNISKYLPANSVLVFNQTKVVPAKLSVTKTTGGKAELLYLAHDKKFIRALSNKKLALNSTVSLFYGRKIMKLKVIQISEREYTLKPKFPVKQIISILQKSGKTPLPPYIKNSPLTESAKRMEYQTVFAKTGESVAAPTASLHFTKELIFNLRKQGFEIEFINLNVGLGTFSPLTEQNLTTGKLHSEFFQIDKTVATRLNKYKSEDKKIIAVGTTCVRTLESATDKAAKLTKLSGNTDLFIKPGFEFKFIDGMITNFHVPKSSLLMLVATFMGKRRLFEIYEKAILKKIRFFSFGDGMLILP